MGLFQDQLTRIEDKSTALSKAILALPMQGKVFLDFYAIKYLTDKFEYSDPIAAAEEALKYALENDLNSRATARVKTFVVCNRIIALAQDETVQLTAKAVKEIVADTRYPNIQSAISNAIAYANGTDVDKTFINNMKALAETVKIV